MVRPRGLEPLTYGLAYHYSFHCLELSQYNCTEKLPICGLDYIFTISGGTRIVSTDPGVSFPCSTRARRSFKQVWPNSHRFPRYCRRIYDLNDQITLRFHRYSVLHFARSVSGRRLLHNDPGNYTRCQLKAVALSG